ncbi:ras GTPase-activating-like protein IQGAP3, partial [Sinocyclocheilus grahami]|uniref:ras GTPase-activating-like protein IQGAP3 n=1 Tax=Sinocyclocheilus grahami TaxID=75366 RepID=UPI0007ACB073
RAAVEQVDEALDCSDSLALFSALQNSSLALTGLIRDHAGWYLEQLTSDREQKALDLGCVDPLERDELQEGVSVANEEAQRDRTLQQAVCKINEAVQRGEARQTVRALMNTDAHLPDVYPFAAELYQRELAPLHACVCMQGELQQEELFVAVEMLSAVALVNQAVEVQDFGAFSATLLSPAAGLADIDDSLMQRYFEQLCELKRRAGKALLSWNDLQTGLNAVNSAAHEEHEQILTIGLINQALSRSDPQKTLSALMLASSGLQDIFPLNARRYHDVLTRAKRHKAE